MAQNPLMAELLALQEQLAIAERRLTDLNNERTRLGLTYDLGTPVIQAADRAVQDQVAVVNRLKELVKAKQEAVAALDAAAAAAVSQGLTAEAGYQKALGDLERSKGLKYIAIGVAIILVLFALWYFIWRKK